MKMLDSPTIDRTRGVGKSTPWLADGLKGGKVVLLGASEQTSVSRQPREREREIAVALGAEISKYRAKNKTEVVADGHPNVRFIFGYAPKPRET